MKKSLFLLTIVSLLYTAAGFAQPPKGQDFEKFKSQKISFLTEKLNLSPREAQEFWPVYNQYEKDRMELQQHRRGLEQKTRDENIKMSDQEVIKIVHEITETFKKEADNVASYNEKFLKILPPQKVLLLFRAENQFRVHMFEQYRKQRDGEKH